MKRLTSVIVIIIALLSSCRRSNDSSSYEFIDPEGWDYRATLSFTPELKDSVAHGMLELSLRHSNEYLYSNVYIEVTVKDSLSTRVDTLNMTLADDFGRWYGKGIGTDFQVTDTVANDIMLRRGSKISVRHIMRCDNLKDIDRVGIKFTEKKK